MKPIRSFLFVPASRPSWVAKVPALGADAVILDLEDSVPADLKASARANLATAIADLARQGQRLWVRPNKGPYVYDMDDLAAVVQPGLEGLVLPKPNGPEDIDVLAAVVSDLEHRRGLAIGATLFVPTLETARSVEHAYEIAQRPRVATLVFASAKNGDVARALGFQWAADGLETLAYRSRVVLACRAAGKPYPLGGLWQDVHDLDGLRRFAQANRRLGFTGEMILHPSNVAVVNEVYTPGPEEVAYYEGMIRAFDEAQAAGRAAVLYEGEHIDAAHVKTAREILALARAFRAGPAAPRGAGGTP